MCPKEWIYSHEDECCYSLPFPQKANLLGAQLQCENFYYQSANLVTNQVYYDENDKSEGSEDFQLRVERGFIAALTNSTSKNFEITIWIQSDLLSIKSLALAGKLNKYMKEYDLDNASRTHCPVVIISNGSWVVDYENCSRLNYFLCALGPPECPEWNRTFFDQLHITEFALHESGLGMPQTRSFGTHTVSCESKSYRIPSRVLEARGPRSNFETLYTDATGQNLVFFNNQELKPKAQVISNGIILSWFHANRESAEL